MLRQCSSLELIQQASCGGLRALHRSEYPSPEFTLTGGRRKRKRVNTYGEFPNPTRDIPDWVEDRRLHRLSKLGCRWWRLGSNAQLLAAKCSFRSRPTGTLTNGYSERL
jgi:hypothetical protein